MNNTNAPSIVSAVVTGGFVGAFGLAVYLKNTEMMTAFGSILGAQFVAVVQYWVGSSSGSARKTEILAAPKP